MDNINKTNDAEKDRAFNVIYLNKEILGCHEYAAKYDEKYPQAVDRFSLQGVITSLQSLINSSTGDEQSIAENAGQGDKADNPKDIEVYIPVPIEKGEQFWTVDKTIILFDNGEAKMWKDEDFPNAEPTHWLKKVKISEIL